MQFFIMIWLLQKEKKKINDLFSQASSYNNLKVVYLKNDLFGAMIFIIKAFILGYGLTK